MKYDNIKKYASVVSWALIINIIGSALEIVSITVGVGAYNWQGEIASILSAVGGFLVFVASVLILRYLWVAQKDEKYFRYVFIFTAIAIPLQVITKGFRLFGDDVTFTIFGATSSIIECILVMTTCIGLSKVYEKLGNEKGERTALGVGILFTVIYTLFKVVEIVLASNQAALWDWPTLITLCVVDCLLVAAANLMCIIYLRKVYKEL